MIIYRIINDPEGYDRALDEDGKRLGSFINLNEEYVELRNEGAREQDIGLWSLEDDEGRSFIFPDGIAVAPGLAVKLHTGAGTNSETDFYWGRKAPVWDNRGDRARLYDKYKNLIDERQAGPLVPLSGNVTDTSTGAPLEGVSVSVNGIKRMETGQDGSYAVEIVCIQESVTATIMLAKRGYMPLKREVTVVKGQANSRDFSMEPLTAGAHVVNVSVVSASAPAECDWKVPYTVSLTLKNNGMPITDLTVHLTETSGSDVETVPPLDHPGFHGNGDTWTIDYRIVKDDAWYSKGFAWCDARYTEKDYEYNASFIARCNDDIESSPQAVSIGTTKINVPQDKIDAMDTYNNWTTAEAVGIVICVAAAATGIGLLIGGVAVAAGIVGGVSAVAGGGAAASSFSRDSYKEKMDDPPEIDPDFVKVYRPRVKTLRTKSKKEVIQDSIAVFNHMAKYKEYTHAMMKANNRLFTAALYGDAKAARKQVEAMEDYAGRNQEAVAKIKDSYGRLYDAMGGQLGVTADSFVKVQRYLDENGYPASLQDRQKRYGMTEDRLNAIKEMVMKMDPEMLDLDILSLYGKIIKSMDKESKAMVRRANSYKKSLARGRSYRQMARSMK